MIYLYDTDAFFPAASNDDIGFPPRIPHCLPYPILFILTAFFPFAANQSSERR